MDDEKKSSGGLPASVWLVALVAAGAYFVHDVPLQGSRPAATDPKPYAHRARQDVDARLWEDPLSAIARSRERGTKRPAATTAVSTQGDAEANAGAKEEDQHSVAAFRQEVRRREALVPPTPDVPVARIVAVMVQGGSYAESVEARRRARYAVLASLNRSQYTPEDAAHLGYVLPEPDEDPESQLPAFVAYEWFEGSDKVAPILVLWLDEYAFAPKTAARIGALKRQLKIETLPFVVIGPAYSSTLHDMAADPATPVDPGMQGTTFYAYGATSDDAEILKGTPLLPKREGFVEPLSPFDGQLHAAFRGKRLEVFRTITSDRRLVEALRDELALRGVNPVGNDSCSDDGLQHVVLIAEWDTLYGRTLPTLMNDALQPSEPRCRSTRNYVHRFSYLRGLDGQLPALESAPAGEGKQTDKTATTPATTDRSELRRRIERPDGQGQLDYLRRMTADLQSLDRGWRRRGGSIVAIGVLGSDVFDKLLILQALRSEFPGAVFFTTDLDARMLHPVEQAWARNVIVASSFGLQLKPELQVDIPPFRDNYQTSVYFSTMLALSDVVRHDRSPPRFVQSQIDRGLDHARLFEIGRTAAFDYSPSFNRAFCDGASACGGSAASSLPNGNGAAGSRRAACLSASQDALDRALCDGIHPDRSPMSPSSGPARFYKELLLLVVAALLIYAAYRTVRWQERQWATSIPASTGGSQALSPPVGPASEDEPPGSDTTEISFGQWLGRRRRTLTVVGVAIAILIAARLGATPLYHWFSTRVFEMGNGEPINFVEGISIWPTELIRVFVVFFSAAFIAIAWRELTGNLAKISDDFRFKPVYRDMVRMAKGQYATWPMWKRLVRMFSFRLEEAGGGPQKRIAGLTWSAQLFWEKYLYQGFFLSRCARVVLCIVVFWMIGGWIMSRFGYPNTPYRGALSRNVNGLMLFLSVSAMLAVLFFVVDALVFCVQLIRALQGDILGAPSKLHDTVRSRWAQSTRDYYAVRFAASGRQLDALILMDFIAARTAVVANLVYYPFVVIALMVLSRSNLIDNWTMPVGLVFIFVASVVIIMTCAVRLRMAAESARSQVIELLDNDLLRRRRDDGDHAAQIEAMIARVRGLRSGAFAPYTQQPFLRATLLPLTTLGGPALLELLAATNF